MKPSDYMGVENVDDLTKVRTSRAEQFKPDIERAVRASAGNLDELLVQRELCLGMMDVYQHGLTVIEEELKRVQQ